MEENTMKKVAYVIAAICAIAVVAPSFANAEEIVIKRGGHHHHDWHHDRGHHHGHDRGMMRHRN
jgi:hypothetical protein